MFTSRRVERCEWAQPVTIAVDEQHGLAGSDLEHAKAGSGRVEVEEPLLLDPCLDEPTEHLEYEADGRILACCVERCLYLLQ